MNLNDAMYFAGLMEDYLEIPAFICENIENKLANEEYKDVIEFIIKRKKVLNEEREEDKNED